MTATRRCGTLQLGWPISTQARGHAPARHAAWIAVPWFALAPACASLHQHMQVGPERPLSQLTDSHTKHACYKAPKHPPLYAHTEYCNAQHTA